MSRFEPGILEIQESLTLIPEIQDFLTWPPPTEHDSKTQCESHFVSKHGFGPLKMTERADVSRFVSKDSQHGPYSWLCLALTMF